MGGKDREIGREREIDSVGKQLLVMHVSITDFKKRGHAPLDNVILVGKFIFQG